MRKDARIYLAGHTGLAGSAILRRLKDSGYEKILVERHDELDLTDQNCTFQYLRQEQPDVVILAAAKVGGIQANSSVPAEFIEQNLAIQANVITGAFKAGVRRVLFLGSSCIYPRDCPQPIKESELLSGPLEWTNRPYAIAKIAGIELCWAYNRQYGTRYLAAMPTNLYGVNDNYHLENSHVVPALIRKVHKAKTLGANSFVAWGTGTVRREFLFGDDFADACVFLLTMSQEQEAQILSEEHPPIINIGSGEDMTIKELVSVICEVVGFRGKVEWDHSKPDGTPQKLLDHSLLLSLGWQPFTGLRQGLEIAYQDMLHKVLV